MLTNLCHVMCSVECSYLFLTCWKCNKNIQIQSKWLANRGWRVYVDVFFKKCSYLGVYYSILIILTYVVVYEDVLNTMVKRVDPQRLPPQKGEGISSPPGQKNRHRKFWKTMDEGIKAPKLTLKSSWGQNAYQSKWSWKPPRPWTELRYWYKYLSPPEVVTRSSARLRTVSLLLQRILPAVIFTLNWVESDKRSQRDN